MTDPRYPMNTVSGFALKPGDPAERHATEELVENKEVSLAIDL